MATHKVEGFNAKEQKCFNRLLDGEPHDIRELKKLYWKDAEVQCKETWENPGEHEVNGQAQSYARNSLRRLIRDGWVEKCSRGTYRMTSNGKKWVEAGKAITKSKTSSQRGKGGGAPKKTTKKKVTKKAAPKKATTKKAASEKATTKKAAKVKAKSSNGVSKKVNTDKVKKMKAKSKLAAAKEKFAEQKEAN